MTTQNSEFWKFQCNAIEIRDRAPGLGFPERSRVSDLCTEWNVELATFGEKRVVAPVIGRQTPQPWQEPEALEPVLFDALAKLANAFYRSVKIDRSNTCKAVWIRRAMGFYCRVVCFSPIKGPILS